MPALSGNALDRVIERVKQGEDSQIEPQQLDRVLVLHENTSTLAATKKAARPPAPLFDGMAVSARATYTNLILKGLSGSASRRFAMINDETFAANDSAKVRMGGSNVV